MIRALRSHWPEYLMEAIGLAIFMICAGVVGTALFSPLSPAYEAIPAPLVRRLLMGLAMGLTAVLIIYSPWGRRSGAHINPATTLTFWRLGKVSGWDAIGYVIAQFLGGLAGVGVVALALGDVFLDPPVFAVATRPGIFGIVGALAAEIAITFVLMSIVLRVSNSLRFERFTGLVVGILVATYITFEDSISGMSMNPARTFASAVFAGDYRSLWIYFVAPPLGMLLAAQAYLWQRGPSSVECAKYRHDYSYRCIFCEYQHHQEQALVAVNNPSADMRPAPASR